MRRRLFMISVMRLGEIPTARASAPCDKSYSVRNSSFRISPGVTGANSPLCIAASSVIVPDPDLMRMAIDPFENNAPLVIDADRVKFAQASLEFFQTVRRRYEEVVQPA